MRDVKRPGPQRKLADDEEEPSEVLDELEEEEAREPRSSTLAASGFVSDSGPRDSFFFRVPRKARRRDHDPKTFEIRELTPKELLEARKIGKAESSGGEAAVVLSLYKVDGQVVNHGEDEGTLLYTRWSSKCRSLVALAWREVHTTSDEEDEAFLKTMEVRSG